MVVLLRIISKRIYLTVNLRLMNTSLPGIQLQQLNLKFKDPITDEPEISSHQRSE